MGKSNWVNTTLLGIVIVMLGWFFNKGFEKMDSLNTTSIRTAERLSGVEMKIGEMVTRAEFRSELEKRDAQIAELTRKLDGVKRAP